MQNVYKVSDLERVQMHFKEGVAMQKAGMVKKW